MKRIGVHAAWVIAGLFGMLPPNRTLADGGSVQLRQAKGPFLVTIFLPPETVCGGPGDVSVLVQSQKNGEVVLDANVSLALYPPLSFATNRADPFCGQSPASARLPDGLQAVSSRPTHASASNKLLYAAAVQFEVPGIWRLQATVTRGSDRESFDCPISIASTSANPPGLWACLAFPPIAIIAFGLNQMLRRRSLENGRLSRSTMSKPVQKISNPHSILDLPGTPSLRQHTLR